MADAKYYINKLKLQKHTEGGWFKEIYRSQELIEQQSLNKRFSGNRNISTSIYFLLEKSQFSAFHRIKSDEIWHFYDGGMIEIYSISPKGELRIHKLGLNIENGELPQIIIPGGEYFAAVPSTDFTLVGCTVAPGFDFEDFEMPSKHELIEQFPGQTEIIEKLGSAFAKASATKGRWK